MDDILDRLTNRAALRDALQDTPLAGPSLIAIDDKALSSALKQEVFGQNAVCDDVARQIKLRAAKSRRSVPLGVFLFVGPPATGKTHFAKMLATALPAEFGVTFLDMTQHSEAHTASALFGQAKGYVGSDRYGSLTAALKANSRQVVILDEFEKAHREVQEKFLIAWNDGFVSEVSTGEKVSTVDAVFIATSNAAYQEMAALAASLAGDREQLSEACKRVLQAHFSAPVLSRLDYVFPFLPLEDEDLARLVARQVEASVHDFDLALADRGLDYRILLDLIRRARRKEADAREIRRMIGRAIDGKLLEFKDGHPRVKSVQLIREESGDVAVAPG